MLDRRVGLQQLVQCQDVLPTEWRASAWMLGVRPWRRALVCVVLRDRAAAETVVEQGNAGRGAVQYVRHLALGGDEAAAAQAAQDSWPAAPRNSQVEGGEDGPRLRGRRRCSP